MTTNQTPIPEHTSLNAVVVGKRNGETLVAARMDDDDAPWAMQYPASCFQWSSWRQLCGGLTDIRVVDVPELAAQIDQLKDRVADLEAAAIYAEGVHQGEVESQRARLKARIRELEDAPALSEEQMETLRDAVRQAEEHGDGVNAAAIIRDAFPDVFAEPEPGAEEPKYGDGDLPYGLTMDKDGSYLDWRGEHYTRIAELEAARLEPGPWLRGDELKAVMPTLKADDVVEVDCRGYTVTGKLWAHSPSGLSLWSSIVRTSDGKPGPYVDALRIIERAPEPEPEPGAGIPDAVVEAAWSAFEAAGEVLFAALAAADAKRAELEGQA